MGRTTYTTVGVKEDTHETLSEYRDSVGYDSFEEMIRTEINAEFED